MTKIHETAIVSPETELGNDIEIGPFSIINEHVRIGDGTVIGRIAKSFLAAPLETHQRI